MASRFAAQGNSIVVELLMAGTLKGSRDVGNIRNILMLQHASINALAKHLHRQYRNVFDDVKTMERLGLVEKDTSGHLLCPLG